MFILVYIYLYFNINVYTTCIYGLLFVLKEKGCISEYLR
jgi:hypothetical protein